jgi:hypothetical protein
MRPFWLILIALVIFQPEGTMLFSKRVPLVASQIHPPASLLPTTTPEPLREPKYAAAQVAPGGIGMIAVTPAAVPMNACSAPPPFVPDPATCPRLLIAKPEELLQPLGSGINVVPETLPMSA